MNDAEVKAQARRYSMVIQWSDQDHIYVVSLPEWEQQGGLHGHTHGATYDEAVHMGEELLELLVESAVANGETLPEPRVYAGVR
jgi:antitoxin HicB